MNKDVTALLCRQLYKLMSDNFEAFLVGAFKEMHGSEMKCNWHHDVICDSLKECYLGNEKRLIINVPPRSLKSFICNVAWPAWLMGRNPRIKIISISYAQELSGKFSRDQRQLMSSDWYQTIFPKTKLNPRKSGESEFETTSGGFRLATSTGGILTGRGADIIIIDDPIKPQDAYSETQRANCISWIENTLMTRLDNKQKGIMVMIMQRLHEEDPSGHFLEKGGWKHLNFPAIAEDDERWKLSNGKIYARKQGALLHPEHESVEILNNLKRDIGVMNYSAQYQQCPMPAEGNIIKDDWFRYYNKLPEVAYKEYVISIDSAMKNGADNDWSVCTVWLKYKKDYYLVDVVRRKMNFPELQRCVKKLVQDYRPRNILVEDKGSGTSLIQQLKAENIICAPCKPVGDKSERFSAASIAFEQGRVFFPDNKPNWLDTLKHELLSFPGCKHDDQVDSVSQFLNWTLIKSQSGLQIIKIQGF